MEVHVGAVEKRIALAQHRDCPSGEKMRGDGLGRGVVEVGDLALIGVMILVDLSRHRVVERQFGHARLQKTFDHRAAVAVASGLGEIGDDIRFAERPDRLYGQEFRIAGTRSDADKPA